MSTDDLLDLEQSIEKAKCVADILFSETAEAAQTRASKAYQERFFNLTSVIVDYLAAAKKEIERLENTING